LLSPGNTWIVEASLISGDEVRSAVSEVHSALLRVQPVIFEGSTTTDEWPLQGVEDGLSALEDALRAELAMPGRVGSRPRLGRR
jgi:hypothetical protein